MCTPALIAGGLQAATSYQQIQGAKEAEKYRVSQGKVNEAEALRAMVSSLRGTADRASQERVSTSQALLQLTREAEAARGAVQVQRAASSVSGKSVDALVQDFTRQELVRRNVLETNLDNSLTEISRTNEEIAAQASTRIRQGYGTPVPIPSLLGAAVQIGTSAYSAYLTSTNYGQSNAKKE